VALAGLHPGLLANAEWTLAVADFYGVPVRVTSVYRSWQSQRALRDNFERCVARGDFRRTRECRFPANRPGDSAHNFGLAWDSVVDARYQDWWNAVRRHAGFEVPTGDLIHAQLPRWRDFAGSLAA